MAGISKFFLARNLTETLEQFFNRTELQNINWISIAVNKKSFADSLLTREVDVFTEKDAYALKLGLDKKEIQTQLWKNQISEKKGVLPENSPLLLRYNEFIDHLLEKKIHLYQMTLSKLDEKSFSSTEIATEDKALEWIKVSFNMLEKAVVQSLTDPELLFQTMLFMGTNPKTNQEEIRLITFNLDIKFEFLRNNLLRIRIYNDKNEEFGTVKKASLEGDFNFRKREMMDELTRMLSVISSGIKIT
jgi:hypothetical protein